MIAKEEVFVHGRVALLEDVHVDVVCWCTHEAMPRLADPQFVPGGKERMDGRGSLEVLPVDQGVPLRRLCPVGRAR
jgi:hypothetical protein